MSDSQKFISRNRAPRVQIEYDVEIYGAQKKMQLPFVMGVMSDLSGKSEVDKGAVADRSFLEFDVDNFDSRMRAMKPRAAFSVPNTLTGEGNLSVDLVFEKMEDFSPAAVAAKVEPLRKLLEARRQLDNLLTYMDGKAGAEDLLEKLLKDPTTFRALALGGGDAPDKTDAAFEALKSATPDQVQARDTSQQDALDALRATPQAPESDDDPEQDILAALADSANDIDDTPPPDPLAGIEFDAVEEEAEEADPLANLEFDVEEEAEEVDPLANLEFDVEDEAEEEDPLAGIEFDTVEEEAEEADPLANLEFDVEDEAEEADPLAGIEFDTVDEETEEADPLANLEFDVEEETEDEGPLAGIEFDAMEEESEEADPLANLEFDGEDESEDEDPLAGIEFDAVEEEAEEADPLANLEFDVEEEIEEADPLASLEFDVEDEAEEEDPLAGIEFNAVEEEAEEADPLADLEIDVEDEGEEDPLAGLDDAGDEEALADIDLDDGDPTDDEGGEPDDSEAQPAKPEFTPDFGTMDAPALKDEAGARRKFRIAVLGDFSGRGNRGDLETGEALGKRKGFKLDFDTMEQVVQRFRTTLTLPLGNDGTAVEVELNELDDLHPDELFENVELFSELNMLRSNLKSGRNLDAAIARMQSWGDEFGSFKLRSRKRAKGSAAPADMRLSDFQNLIGDTAPRAEASEASDLISRIIGPQIKAADDAGTEEMIAVVDRAISAAMGSVLHHPDFQTVEAAWRSIELLSRRVETSAELEIVVYDLSVEEFTADLASVENMAETGLFDMLVEKPRLDESAGPISAVVGLYTWEETPTHAEVLARMARICAHMDAPFISAVSTGYLALKPEDRHPLTIKTWDALQALPEAKYLGLATPRFLMRMPYGKKTDPIDAFAYEEFNTRDGMRSLLLANPAVQVAVLLAKTKSDQGAKMRLGSVLALDDMPFHYMTDQYGDQVALPCTERLLNVRTAADTVARGFMPVLSVQGQNVVKLGSFHAVGGGELLGIWSGEDAKQLGTVAGEDVSIGLSSTGEAGAPDEGGTKAPAPAKSGGGDDDDDDDMDLGFDMGGDDDDDMDLGFDLGGDDDDGGFDLDMGNDDDGDMDLDLDALMSGDDDDDDGGLDDLLSGFGDDDDDDDDDDIDLDLDALLGDL